MSSPLTGWAGSAQSVPGAAGRARGTDWADPAHPVSGDDIDVALDQAGVLLAGPFPPVTAHVEEQSVARFELDAGLIEGNVDVVAADGVGGIGPVGPAGGGHVDHD